MSAIDAQPAWQREIQIAAIACGLLLFAAMIGILSRPMGNLAAVWPANAVMLGAFVRFSALNRPSGWIGALCGYMIADLATGSPIFKACLLTSANLAGVFIGIQLFNRLDLAHRRLTRPLSVPFMALIVAAAATASGVVGMMINPVLFGGGMVDGWQFWFAAELVNHMALVPVLLTLPEPSSLFTDRRRSHQNWSSLAVKLAPGIALVMSCILGMAIGGPGALAFPVPALLWAALSYNLFTTAILTFLFGTWVLVSISTGYLAMATVDMDSRMTLLSLRIGVTLVTLAPLTVASVVTARNELLRKFEYMANHDQLSGLLNRAAFTRDAGMLLNRMSRDSRSVSVLMLDLDHFKQVNDAYGHAGGDQAIIAFAKRSAEGLRDGDLFGRMGGEEFALVLPDCSAAEAQAVAERIRRVYAETPITLADGREIHASVSIGVAVAERAISDVELMLVVADKALYRAKAGGRNRVEVDMFDTIVARESQHDGFGRLKANQALI